MPYKLISLVFLLIFLIINKAYAENEFLLPVKKPSIFKKFENDINKNLPQSKPIIQKPIEEKKTVITSQSQKIKPKVAEILKKKEIKKSVFLIPQRKPITYKLSSKEIEKSSVLNQKDFAKAKETIKFIKARKWNSALKSSEKIKNSEFRNLVTWMYLKTTGNAASFNDYKNFIEQHEDYPRINRIKYLAEQKIYLRNNSPTSIINWFKKNPPLGGIGKIKLAEAYLEQGKVDEVKTLIKDGWVTADISKSNLGYYRAKFKKFLNSDDHLARADFLAWEKKYWDLKRMLRYLPKDERALYNARQILMSNSYGVDNAISKVPAHLKKDPGLEFDRLRWRNRRGRLEGSLEILYKNANKTQSQMIRPDKWWEQRKSVARTLIYKKRYKTAYKVASEHSLSAGPEFAEAEWLSGWIALSFLNSPEYAINHFENFYNNVGYPISLARGAYWLGQTYKTLNNKELSNKYFSEGAKFPMTYYGQLSFNEIKPGENFELIDQSDFNKEYQKEFNKNKLINHVVLLKELNATQYAKDIIKHLATLNVEKGSEVLAAKLSTDIERYDFAIQVSKIASYQKRFHNRFNYPIISTPKTINGRKIPESAFILSIIRQESEFDLSANSHAGAKGLMQLMPYTAKLVSKQAKLPYVKSRLTTDPEYNINLGSHYIAGLLMEYEGAYPFAIAAYNAGPNRVKRWKKINKNPQKNEVDYIDWIELIKFKETRNYVQRVLENYNVYRYVLEKKQIKMKNFFLNDPLY